MESAKEYLQENMPQLLQELESKLLRSIVTDAMELYALEVAEDIVKNSNTPDAMAILPPSLLEKINRVEVIDQKGRTYVNWKPTNKTEISLQDNGKTLKVFISN